MSGDRPLVTIILPTYNRSNVLVYAMRSVLYQTYQNFELIVVGDGCTDDTGSVVQCFRDPRITWLDLPKGFGCGFGNRNLALEQARGELIAYQQHDDLWFPDHLALLVSAILRENAEVVYSRPIHVLQDGTVYQHPYDVRLPHYREMLLSGDNRISSSNIMHRLSVVRDVGGWNGQLARRGDVEYWQRMLRGGKRFCYVPVPTALCFAASIRPNAYRDREEHEQRAYYEQIAADPCWVTTFRQRMAEDLECRFMEQEANLAARQAVINELTAAVRAFEADRSALRDKLRQLERLLLARLRRIFRRWRGGGGRESRPGALVES
jgi:glycosyltransferase involved in cell wall biosynthesis